MAEDTATATVTAAKPAVEPKAAPKAVPKASAPKGAGNYFYALGRRKSATARVRLSVGGKGVILVNEKPADEYFADSKYLLAKLNQPFVALAQENTYTITTHVSGGGHDGQIEAIRLGISKALALLNGDLKSTLKRADLLGRDSREKERKKFGLKGARKQRQFTKR